jgi:hypothetical protein
MKRMRVAVLALAAVTGATAASAAGQSVSGAGPLPTTAFSAKASLHGAEVIPGPGDPDGTGEFGINPRRRQGEVCYGLQVDGLDTITGASIHKARRHQAGPARLTLFSDAAGRPGAGYYEECVSGVKRRLIKRIFKAREGGTRHWYVEVTTVAYPNGAVRGQLGPGDYSLNLPDRSN